MVTINDLSDSMHILSKHLDGELIIETAEKYITSEREPCLIIYKNIVEDLNEREHEELLSFGWFFDGILNQMYLPITRKR